MRTETMPDYVEEKWGKMLNESIEQNESLRPEKWWQFAISDFHDAWLEEKEKRQELEKKLADLERELGRMAYEWAKRGNV